MKVLESSFRKKGVTYEEVMRLAIFDQDWRVYERSIDGVVSGFTVARIKINPASVRTFDGKEVHCEESESFPSSEDWGTLAFDCGKAKEMYLSMLRNIEAKAIINKSGKTVAQVADLLGISRQSVTGWMNGSKRITPANLFYLRGNLNGQEQK